jgi:GntR family transcriptional regulator/MocR family aminotransferase
MGYMAAPENFISAAAQLKMMIDIRGDYLLEEAMAAMFTGGHMQKHLKKCLKLYHQRRDMLCALLENELGSAVSFTKPQGGMAVWAKFDKKYPLPEIARKASALGLYMTDGRIYNTDKVDYNALRIGFASLNEREMGEAVDIIKRAL